MYVGRVALWVHARWRGWVGDGGRGEFICVCDSGMRQSVWVRPAICSCHHHASDLTKSSRLFVLVCVLYAPALNLQRYKYMVHVVIGQQRGEGVRMGCRCLWDQNTDNFASDTFVNVSPGCMGLNHLLGCVYE